MGLGKGLNEVKEKKNLFRLSFAYQCKRLSSTCYFFIRNTQLLHLQEKGGVRKKISTTFLIKVIFNIRICIHYLQTTHLLRSTALVQGTW